MANAGRVAIVPKGDWNAAAEYKRLDAVAYNNTLYIAKKAVPAGTLPTDTEYWMKCVVGSAGSIATTEDAGTVKAGDDIGVDSTGEMILKTDFTTQEELAEMTGDEDRKTFFGKIAKAISDFVAHKTLKATASEAGHVKLNNSSAITTAGEYALDVVEKNASIPGTMANQIAHLNTDLKTRYLGVSIKDTVIINAFCNIFAFTNGKSADNELSAIYMSGCNFDEYNIAIVFSNHSMNNESSVISYEKGSTNHAITFTTPLDITFSGSIWITGIAVASRA